MVTTYNAEGSAVQQIARILRIMSIRSFRDATVFPIVELNWYCGKDDVASAFQKYSECISNYEVFLTEINSVVPLEQIEYKVSVLTFEEYDKKLDDSGNNIFFMRSAYNSFQQTLIPHPDFWKTTCICKVPQNPDRTYVFCEICQQWIHIECAGISADQVKKIEHYVCALCANKKPFNNGY